MQRTYTAKQWREQFRRCTTARQRDALVGPPMNLAARMLGITRSRIAQLIQEDKLDSVVVTDELTKVRIAYMITLDSLERRRKVKRNPGQWQPREIV
jgi:hypothetical protein